MWKLRVRALALLLILPACHGKQNAPTYTTVGVERGKVVARVTATGTLSALVTVQVGTQVSGRIAQLMVDFNSPVKKNQVLAKIDPQLFDAALESAKANEKQAEGQLAQAKAAAVNAELQYKREVDLFARKLVAQADLDTAKATADGTAASVLASEGNLEQAKAQRHQAQVNLDYTTITSPIDGTVISRAVDVGQTVAASLSAPTIFTIAQDLAQMQVDTNVAEADVGKLQPGMSSTFTVDAYPGEKFRGVIRQIRNAAQTVQNVVTYDAVIDVANADLKLRPGMTTNVTFVFATADDVLRVPNAALRFKPADAPIGTGGGGHHFGHRDGGGGSGELAMAGGHGGDHERPSGESGPRNDAKTIYVLRGIAPQAVPIQVGITDGSFTEVASGAVEEGDLVITDSSDSGVQKPGGPGGPGGARLGRMF